MYPSYRGKLMGRICLNHLQSYLAYPLSSKEIFVPKIGVIRVNPWVELVQSTPTIILHIFSEFQRDFMGTITVSMVNSWEELYQSTPKAILHIYTDFARGLPGCTRVTGANACVECV